MYIPKHFEQTSPDELRSIIRDYPFATLITISDSGLEANHIPFFLNQVNGKDVLQGHLSKGNPLWKNLKNESEVLVVFQGPHSYVSPSNYPTKQETGKVVPTWNYIAVHVKGTMKCIHDLSWCMEMINNLTKQHERKQNVPWAVSDAPEEFTKNMVSGIVGIEIDISAMSGKWKVSQNQPERNQLGVVAGLSIIPDTGSQKMADIMKNLAVGATNKSSN